MKRLFFFLRIPFLFMDDSSCTDAPFFRPSALWREKYRKLPGGFTGERITAFRFGKLPFGADFTLGAGYRWRLNRPDTGWFFDLSLSEDMAATAMDSVIFLLTCIRRMWAEKESVICGRHLLLEVWDGTCFED